VAPTQRYLPKPWSTVTQSSHSDEDEEAWSLSLTQTEPFVLLGPSEEKQKQEQELKAHSHVVVFEQWHDLPNELKVNEPRGASLRFTSLHFKWLIWLHGCALGGCAVVAVASRCGRLR
jgi:hypothetical protein